ncbi:MAG: Hpt domain-containing protein [Pseudomarimonas sp.]
MDTPCLDHDRLAEIASLEAFRPGFRDRLIGLFEAAVHQQLPVCVGDVEASASERQHAAHALKGAASGIGALHLAALAQQLEQIARTPAADWPDPTALKQAATDATMALRAWSIAQHGAP